MDGVITEKNYPIRMLWVFKDLVRALVILLFFILFVLFSIFRAGPIDLFSSPFLIVFALFFLTVTLVFCVPIFITILRRAKFHYSFEEEFIVLHQGIISKQNRNVPYGRIQGIFVNQGLFDRIFGLASLTFEDYSEGGRSAMSVGGYVGSGNSRHEILGFVGNKIHIPGLKKDDAEALKAVILQRIKENPIEDSQSGL